VQSLAARFARDEAGQDMLEYAFLAVFMALAISAGLQAIASGLNTHMSNIGAVIATGS
jgi:Flp pilus assembly pilin Flp